jgi:hypothetical protein
MQALAFVLALSQLGAPVVTAGDPAPPVPPVESEAPVVTTPAAPAPDAASPVPDPAPSDVEAPPDAEPVETDVSADPDAVDPDAELVPEPEPEPEPIAPDPVVSEAAADEDLDAPESLDEPGYDPLRDSPEALGATRLVRSGIAMTSVGGALLIGATIFGTVDPCRRAVGNSCQPEASQRAALTMAIPGILLVAGGTTSLVLGLRRRQRLRTTVAVSRDGAGLWVAGRF